MTRWLSTGADAASSWANKLLGRLSVLVFLSGAAGASRLLAAADESTGTTQSQLEPDTRAAWLLGILAIIVLAVGSCLLIWLSGRMLRRRWQLDQPQPPSPEAQAGYRVALPPADRQQQLPVSSPDSEDSP